MVTLFRNDDDKNEMDEDGDDKKEINKWNGSKEDTDPLDRTCCKSNGPRLTQIEIEQLKIKQTKRTKAKQLTREIVVNIIFVYVLFVACYSNRDEAAYNYSTHLKSLFQDFDNVFHLVFFFINNLMQVLFFIIQGNNRSQLLGLDF